MDFFDILLAKKLEDDRDPKVEGLSVTANGTYSEDGVVYKPVVVNVPETPLSSLSATENKTYTAPAGTGYNVVNVNVPAPENAYLLEEYEDVPTDIASFTASDAPLKSLTASIAPVQEGSGDPSPTNVRPITGWTEEVVYVRGVNQWDEEWERGTINDTTGQNAPENGIMRSKGYIAVKSGIQYYIKKPTKADIYQIFLYGSDKTFMYAVLVSNIINRVYTIPSGCSFIRFRCLAAYGNTYNNDISINYPSTDTEYHAYSGTTTTIPFTDGQGQSVEVFGGSVDVINGGEQPNTTAKIDLGSLNYTYYSGNLFTASISDLKPVPNEILCNALCSIYVAKKGNEYSSIDRSFVAGFNNARILAIHDSRFTDATAFKEAVTGQQLVYELATPTTFYTQPTSIKSLDGENNVSASTGQIESLEFFTKATS